MNRKLSQEDIDWAVRVNRLGVKPYLVAVGLGVSSNCLQTQVPMVSSDTDGKLYLFRNLTHE